MANSEQLRKLFVGGLTRESNEQSLRDAFSRFGTIVDVSVLRDAQQRSRGFGFVVFSDSACVDEIIKAKKDGQAITVDNGHVEVKRALPRTEKGEPRERFTARHSSIKKVFCGGLTSSTTTADLEEYFGKFGKIVDAIVLMDSETKRSRGFGFVTFDDEDAADKVCALKNHEINSKLCEVRKAEPRVNYNNRRERDMMPPYQMNQFPRDPAMQQRLPNAGIDASSLNSAVQLINSLQSLVNAAQLQQTLSQPNPMGNYNQGQLNPPPMQNTAASTANQSNNVLQLLQNALSGGSLPNTQQSNPAPAQTQSNNQLGLLLSALGGSNAGGSAVSQQGLSGLLGQLGSQNTASATVKSEPLNSASSLQGSTSSASTDLPSQSTYHSSSYYDDDYASHSQSSSGYGPVRYPSTTRQSTYRPY